MGRPVTHGPRTPVVVRFDQALLAEIDEWPGGTDRTAKIHSLIRLALLALAAERITQNGARKKET